MINAWRPGDASVIWIIIILGKGLAPFRCQVITCTNGDLLSAGHQEQSPVQFQSKYNSFLQENMLENIVYYMIAFLSWNRCEEIALQTIFRSLVEHKSANAKRNKHVIITSKRLFDVIITCSLRSVFAG